MEILGLAAVAKTYGTGRRGVEVLSNATLSVSFGTVVWIRGASGAGKTTLLCVAGLLTPPTSGEIRLDGMTSASLSGRRAAQLRAQKIGFVFQHHGLLTNLSALENVALACTMRGRRARTRAHDLLSQLGLAERATFPAALLSGGESTRVAVARALVNSPVLLLADEPISGLDSEAAAAVLDRLSAAAAAGCAVVISSHDDTVAAVADRIVVLQDGRLTEVTSAESAELRRTQ